MCKALDQVGSLHLGQRGVEGMLTQAGDDQTHQAGVNHHLIHHILQTCSHKRTRGISIKACDNYYYITHTHTQNKEGLIYSVRCAAAAGPQDHAHVLVRLVPQLYGPSHQEEQLKAASTPPVQKYPAASVSLFLLFCLKRKITISMINTFNLFILICLFIEYPLTLQFFAVHHLHMCIKMFSSFSTEGSGQSALPTSLRGCSNTVCVT